MSVGVFSPPSLSVGRMAECVLISSKESGVLVRGWLFGCGGGVVGEEESTLLAWGVVARFRLGAAQSKATRVVVGTERRRESLIIFSRVLHQRAREMP